LHKEFTNTTSFVQVRYECSMEGCQNFFGDDNMDDVLVVQRETQTVRAVEPRTGQEKWNFSVSQHNLDINAGAASDLCRNRDEEDGDGQEKAGDEVGVIDKYFAFGGDSGPT